MSRNVLSAAACLLLACSGEASRKDSEPLAGPGFAFVAVEEAFARSRPGTLELDAFILEPPPVDPLGVARNRLASFGFDPADFRMATTEDGLVRGYDGEWEYRLEGSVEVLERAHAGSSGFRIHLGDAARDYLRQRLPMATLDEGQPYFFGRRVASQEHLLDRFITAGKTFVWGSEARDDVPEAAVGVLELRLTGHVNGWPLLGPGSGSETILKLDGEGTVVGHTTWLLRVAGSIQLDPALLKSPAVAEEEARQELRGRGLTNWRRSNAQFGYRCSRPEDAQGILAPYYVFEFQSPRLEPSPLGGSASDAGGPPERIWILATTEPEVVNAIKQD